MNDFDSKHNYLGDGCHPEVLGLGLQIERLTIMDETQLAITKVTVAQLS